MLSSLYGCCRSYTSGRGVLLLLRRSCKRVLYDSRQLCTTSSPPSSSAADTQKQWTRSRDLEGPSLRDFIEKDTVTPRLTASSHVTGDEAAAVPYVNVSEFHGNNRRGRVSQQRHLNAHFMSVCPVTETISIILNVQLSEK